MPHTPGPQRTCLTSGCQRKAIENSPSKSFCEPCSDAIARGKRTEHKISPAPDLLDLAAETLAEWHLNSSNMEKTEPPRIKAIRESKAYEQIRQAAMIKIAKAQK